MVQPRKLAIQCNFRSNYAIRWCGKFSGYWFLGGSLIRLFTGPLIELPNFSEVEVKPTRVIFVPKRTEDGTIQYVMSRVEDANKPFVPSGEFSMTPEEWEALD